MKFFNKLRWWQRRCKREIWSSVGQPTMHRDWWLLALLKHPCGDTNLWGGLKQRLRRRRNRTLPERKKTIWLWWMITDWRAKKSLGQKEKWRKEAEIWNKSRPFRLSFQAWKCTWAAFSKSLEVRLCHLMTFKKVMGTIRTTWKFFIWDNSE